ncbi:MAG: hypothetical protein IJ760_00985 [Bacteroidales bacterium]|nr:hypothetical protein [Bacteroidales bacterium]
MIPEKTTRQSGLRVKIENDVLQAYNLMRRKRPQPSPSECYTTLGSQFNMNYYQIQYIILKARKTGKRVL